MRIVTGKKIRDTLRIKEVKRFLSLFRSSISMGDLFASLFSPCVPRKTLQPIRPWKFCQKTRFEASWAVSVTVLPKRTKTYHKTVWLVHFAAFWSRCKILACDVRACAESKKIVLGFKSDPAVLSYSSLSLLPSSFAFLASFFVVCWACSRLHFGGKRFWEGF